MEDGAGFLLQASKGYLMKVPEKRSERPWAPSLGEQKSDFGKALAVWLAKPEGVLNIDSLVYRLENDLRNETTMMQQWANANAASVSKDERKMLWEIVMTQQHRNPGILPSLGVDGLIVAARFCRQHGKPDLARAFSMWAPLLDDGMKSWSVEDWGRLPPEAVGDIIRGMPNSADRAKGQLIFDWFSDNPTAERLQILTEAPPFDAEPEELIRSLHSGQELEQRRALADYALRCWQAKKNTDWQPEHEDVLKRCRAIIAGESQLSDEDTIKTVTDTLAGSRHGDIDFNDWKYPNYLRDELIKALSGTGQMRLRMNLAARLAPRQGSACVAFIERTLCKIPDFDQKALGDFISEASAISPDVQRSIGPLIRNYIWQYDWLPGHQ